MSILKVENLGVKFKNQYDDYVTVVSGPKELILLNSMVWKRWKISLGWDQPLFYERHNKAMEESAVEG